MNFLRLLTNEKPKSDEENVNNIDESNKMAILKDYVQPNENDKTVDPEEDLDDDKEIKTNENINDDVVKNEISNDSSIVDNNIKEKCESENGINDEQKLIKYNISTFPDNKNLKKNNYDKLITENYKTNNRHIGDKRKLNNAYVDHNNEEKLSEDDEEKEFEYYYKKTIDFINTEFFGKNDELKDILNTPESDSKSLSEIDQMNIIHTNNLPDKYILEKMPFCKLINFEKNISTERQRVLNYYNEDRKQIYESSINKERQFSHIFQNTEKYYDAKEILAFLLPYHTFYLDHINIDEDDEDIELINNTEKEIKEIEQSVEEIKQSFVAYANPSIIWSLSRIVDRANHQYKKCRKMRIQIKSRKLNFLFISCKMVKTIFNSQAFYNIKANVADLKKRYICFQRNLVRDNIVKKETPKHEQKPLGSYPVPPEAEMMWRNRHTAYGGYIQQTISPFQQKIVYPFWHMALARWWAKFSSYLWWWIWPFAITHIILWKMFRDAKKYVEQKHWY